MTTTQTPPKQAQPMSKTDLDVASEVAGIEFKEGKGVFAFDGLGDAVQFASLMSRSGALIPKFLQNNPPLCLGIIMRALNWGFDPYALAQSAFQVKDDAQIGYEAKVFIAVLKKAGIDLEYEFEGDYEIVNEPIKSNKGYEISPFQAKGNLTCTAFAYVNGKRLTYQTPELDKIHPKNSSNWHKDPKLQMIYYAARNWARIHSPELMLGAYAREEIEAMDAARDITPKEENSAAVSGFMARAAAARSAMIDQKETVPVDLEAKEADPVEAAPEAEAEDVQQEAEARAEIDPESPEYQMGFKAGQGELLEEDNCPIEDDPDGAMNWIAGFRKGRYEA